MSRLIVAIPAYNEESELSKVIKDIKKHLSREKNALILVVNDGSTDRTVEVAVDSGADIIVSHERNFGVAHAYKTAISTALSYGADVICTIDGDGQHRAIEINKLVGVIRNGDADLVIGSRFIGINNNGVPPVNKCANKLMALLMSFIIGKRIFDTESGFRAISRKAAEELQLLGKVSFANDMILDLSQKGRRIIEVPVTVIYNKTRVSRVITGILRYGFRSLCLISLKILSLRLSLTKMTNYRPPIRMMVEPKFKVTKTQI